MKVSLKCKVSLSKKMRNLFQNGGSVVLTVDSISSGKGEGLLVLSGNNNQMDIDDLIDKETSIMLTPTGIYKGDMNSSVGNLFSNVEQKTHTTQNQQRSPIDRLAAQIPPEHGQNNRAYYMQDELEVPQQFKDTQNPSFMSYVKDYQELFNAVNSSKDKESGIHVTEFSERDSMNERKQKALLLERKAMQESIGIDAYVVNEKCANLTINDIGLDLPLNMPRNLGNLSAKRLASSRELWGLFRQDMIRLVSPNEADHLLKNAGTMNKTYVPELEIYDSHYQAEEQLYDEYGKKVSYAPILDLGSNMLEGDSEEMRNLRMAGRNDAYNNAGGNISTLSGSTRRSFHGSTAEPEYLTDVFSGDEYNLDGRQVGSQSKRNGAGLKTVASRHRR